MWTHAIEYVAYVLSDKAESSEEADLRRVHKSDLIPFGSLVVTKMPCSSKAVSKAVMLVGRFIYLHPSAVSEASVVCNVNENKNALSGVINIRTVFLLIDIQRKNIIPDLPCKGTENAKADATITEIECTQCGKKRLINLKFAKGLRKRKLVCDMLQ